MTSDKSEKKQIPEDKKRTRISQTDIPAYSIDEALRIPRALIENYAGKSTTPLNVASALNVSPTSGPFRMLCGASSAYGLTKGGYNSAEISIESLAKRIISPTIEGDDIAAKREAVLIPKILGDFVRKYQNAQIPRRDIALNVLKGMDVPSDRVESVFDMIIESAQSVGFIKEIKDKQYIDLSGINPTQEEGIHQLEEDTAVIAPTSKTLDKPSPTKELGQAIFIAHGKNKKTVEQLKKILDQFKIPYKIATEEPNLGRPISAKVKEIMQSCNCAILIFTADEESIDKDGKKIWRPSDNVVHELGASSYLYGSRIVILKEDEVVLSTNFSDLGYIPFSKDQLENKSLDLLKELLGFGIVKIST
jgi:predicted nucleotide-binding protein